MILDYMVNIDTIFLLFSCKIIYEPILCYLLRTILHKKVIIFYQPPYAWELIFKNSFYKSTMSKTFPFYL